MPPSGFTKIQAEQIPRFLQSCWTALRSEGEEENLTPGDALRREINNIDSFDYSDNKSILMKPVLYLIRNFYELILMDKPATYDQAESKAISLSETLSAEMAAIHVPNTTLTGAKV